jgi:lipopolysaccharide transport system ATP-binding protein
MQDKAIEVSGLSKQYLIGASKRNSSDSLREWLSAKVRRSGYNAREELIWALKDVSFDVAHGEVVGVIGRNGAGKSTLLKILSRITEPTSGKVVLNGRVGSLLEVGTGFHPELTGRENIYLSGAILGMTRHEIARNFDEIVAFSEVEKFIDTPVKRYSSGMSVRLGFAVAAHLEPEILLIDEVLAVGDAAFQRKCLRKMDDVAKGGRTVLFVSHNMAMVRKICGRALLIDDGQLQSVGETSATVKQYADSMRGGEDQTVLAGVDRTKLDANLGAELIIRDIGLLALDGSSLRSRPVGDGLRIQIHYTAPKKILAPGFIVMLRSYDGVELCRVSNMPISDYYIEELEGDGIVEVTFYMLPFTGGRYYISVGFTSRAGRAISQRWDDVAWFEVASRDLYGSGVALDTRRGYLFIEHAWSHNTGEEFSPFTDS